MINTSQADVVSLTTSSTSGKALVAVSSATTGAGYGIYATAGSPDSTAGYFYNSSSGYGLWGTSVAGIGVYAGSLGTALKASGGTVAISAEGSGKIKSTAKSYLWISGNGVRPYLSTDSTRINMDTVGGAKVYRGATSGNKNVMLPITVPGPLYGQDVTVSGLDVYFLGDTTFEGIQAVLMRRQTGGCETSSCYATILHDTAFHSCEDAVTPAGCTLHFDLSNNNVLTSSSGILYLTLELAFGGDTWVDISGVRLTLEHD